METNKIAKLVKHTCIVKQAMKSHISTLRKGSSLYTLWQQCMLCSFWLMACPQVNLNLQRSNQSLLCHFVFNVLCFQTCPRKWGLMRFSQDAFLVVYLSLSIDSPFTRKVFRIRNTNTFEPGPVHPSDQIYIDLSGLLPQTFYICDSVRKSSP